MAAPDGSGRVDLTRDPHADVTPSWSADGKRIAFASDRGGSMEIYLMNADGSAVTQLTHDSSFADHPRMTADGRYVVYESKKGGNWEIRRIGVDGSGEVDLTRNRASDRYPATSPNGRLVAFSSNRGTSGTHIWVMNIKGSALKQVTVRRGNQFEPAWAPAGGRLAYVSGTLSAGTNIWTVLANGKGNRRLTTLQSDEQLNPSWSPDGRSIVYENCTVSNTGGCTLSVMPLGGNPLDISPLRTPFLDTFDGGDGKLWQSFQNGTGATNTEANGQAHDDACRGLGTGRPVRRDRGALGHHVPPGRRLRRAGRLPAAGVAGRKRRPSHTRLLRHSELRILRDPREPDLGRAVQRLDPAGVHLSAHE